MRAFNEDQKFVTQTFVAVEPDGLDPCDLRQHKGDLALRDLIARRIPLFEFAIKTELKQHNLDTAEGRVNALNATAPLVSQIRDKSLRPEYTRLLAGWLGVEVEIVSRAVAQGARNVPVQQSSNETHGDEPQNDTSWRPDPLEPTLMLEREVLKARVQLPALSTAWTTIEDGSFTHPAYTALATTINSIGATRPLTAEEISDPQMKAIFTELSVEPLKADGEITERYISSIAARLREVRVSRQIADLKSRLQRLNPVENGDEYNASFAQLVSLEATKRTLHELALSSL
jgi:DNA primase